MLKLDRTCLFRIVVTQRYELTVSYDPTVDKLNYVSEFVIHRPYTVSIINNDFNGRSLSRPIIALARSS